VRQHSAALIAIFLIPVTYYVVERFADRRGERTRRTLCALARIEWKR
jgi:hypothetical protein